jgi:hypothetical protein
MKRPVLHDYSISTIKVTQLLAGEEVWRTGLGGQGQSKKQRCGDVEFKIRRRACIATNAG